MEEFILLLYIDSDYIVPLVDSTKGNLFRYNRGEDSRLWLYFREDCDTTDVLYGRDNYRPARMGKPSYFGDYWAQVEKGAVLTVQGLKTPCEELAKRSGLLQELSDWYRSLTYRAHVVPTACIFAENIGHKARKRFLKMLSENGFAVRSFSVPFNSLLAAYCNKYHNVMPDYGSRMVVVSASGNDVDISSLIYWNQEYVSCSDSERVTYDGENPVKMALVKHIIDADNREHGFLTEERLKEEYRYQMPYAEEWMKQLRRTAPDASCLIEYHLSLDPEVRYTRNVKKSFIVGKQQECAKPITEGIERYCRSIDPASISQYIFTGEIFADEEMFEMASFLSREKSIYVSSAAYGDVLHLYMERYAGLEEPLNKYDRILAERDKARESASAWLELAERILDFQRRLDELHASYSERLAAYERYHETALNGVEEMFRRSAFDEAQKALEKLQGKSDELAIYSKEQVGGLLNENSRNKNVYEKVSAYPYAGDIVKRMELSAHGLDVMVGRFAALYALVGEQWKRLEVYRDNYPLYLRLREEFNRATTLIEKRKLLEQMRPITGEVLPEDPSDVEAVEGTLSAEVAFKNGLFGLRRTAEELTVKVGLGSGRLPYHCVLVISDGPISDIDRSKVCFELPKGATGTVTERLKLPAAQFPKAEKLTVRLFIDKEKEPMADIGKVSFNNCYVNLK